MNHPIVRILQPALKSINPLIAVIIAATLLMLFAWTDSAHAQPCRPQMLLEPPVADQWLLDQLAGGQIIRIPFRIEVVANREGCPFLVGFELVHSGQITAHVEQRPFSQPLLDITASDPRRLLTGMAGSNQPVSFDLDLVIAPRPGLTARRLNIHMTQRVYSGSDPADAVETERVREHVRLDIPAGARLIVITDAGEQLLGSAPGFIALGELVSGAQGRAGLSLDGNVGVTLDVEAVNGALVHTEFPQYSVPYILRLAGVTGAGTAGLRTRLRPGDTVDLQIEIGELESVVAGDYQDTLVLTLTTD